MVDGWALLFGVARIRLHAFDFEAHTGLIVLFVSSLLLFVRAYIEGRGSCLTRALCQQKKSPEKKRSVP